MRHVEDLGDLFDLYQHSPGSIAYCARQMREMFEELGDDEGVERAEAVLDEADTVIELE